MSSDSAVSITSPQPLARTQPKTRIDVADYSGAISSEFRGELINSRNVALHEVLPAAIVANLPRPSRKGNGVCACRTLRAQLLDHQAQEATPQSFTIGAVFSRAVGSINEIIGGAEKIIFRQPSLDGPMDDATRAWLQNNAPHLLPVAGTPELPLDVQSKMVHADACDLANQLQQERRALKKLEARVQAAAELALCVKEVGL